MCLTSCSAYRIIVVVNSLILIFGIILIGISSYSIFTYNTDDDNFFSKESYALMLFGGLLTFFVAILAICGGRDPKLRPNYLFCYWCLMSVILMVNAVAFYYFRSFILSIDRTVDSTSSKVLSVVDTSFAKEFQDYILSTYTVCCTGCDDSIAELHCSKLITNEFSTVNCPTSSLNATVADCEYAHLCEFEDLADGNHGLGKGCYTASSVQPSYDVGTDTCNVLSEFTVGGKKLIGEAANGKSCGGGDPANYVQRFNDYFQSKYYLIAVPWGFSIALEGLAWLAAMYLILCPYDPTDKK